MLAPTSAQSRVHRKWWDSLSEPGRMTVFAVWGDSLSQGDVTPVTTISRLPPGWGSRESCVALPPAAGRGTAGLHWLVEGTREA